MSNASTPRPESIAPDRKQELYYAAELLDVAVGVYDTNDLLATAEYLTGRR